MQRKTILNRVEKQKGFVYSEASMTKAGEIEFTLRPRRGSRPICGSCGKKGASVFRAIQWVVHWGIVHRDLTGIESIGIDEIQYRRGHNYLTLVYQLDQGFKRLLYVRKDRSEEARQMHRDGYESVLKNSRWSILKRRSNLTTNQTVKLRELLKYNLRTVKAYLMREDFHRFCLCNLNTLRPER